eukprot:gene7937-1151_t
MPFSSEVAVRVRPSLLNSSPRVTTVPLRGQYGHFTVDAVHDEAASQEAIYSSNVAPLGADGVVLLYGAAGSGKTYSQEGPGSGQLAKDGMVQRAVLSLLKNLITVPRHKYKLSVNYSGLSAGMDGTLVDLLAGGSVLGSLKDSSGALAVSKLVNRELVQAEDINLVVSQGRAARSSVRRSGRMGGGGSSSTSSSSSGSMHTMLTIMLSGTEANNGLLRTKLSFIELASPEPKDQRRLPVQLLNQVSAIVSYLVLRPHQSKPSLIELAPPGPRDALGHPIPGTDPALSRSLSLAFGSLTSVMAALVKVQGEGVTVEEGPPHVPWRDSLLTRWLQDVLSSMERMLVMACVAPGPEAASDTLATLGYSSRFRCPAVVDGVSSRGVSVAATWDEGSRAGLTMSTLFFELLPPPNASHPYQDACGLDPWVFGLTMSTPLRRNAASPQRLTPSPGRTRAGPVGQVLSPYLTLANEEFEFQSTSGSANTERQDPTLELSLRPMTLNPSASIDRREDPPPPMTSKPSVSMGRGEEHPPPMMLNASTSMGGRSIDLPPRRLNASSFMGLGQGEVGQFHAMESASQPQPPSHFPPPLSSSGPSSASGAGGQSMPHLDHPLAPTYELPPHPSTLDNRFLGSHPSYSSGRGSRPHSHPSDHTAGSSQPNAVPSVTGGLASNAAHPSEARTRDRPPQPPPQSQPPPRQPGNGQGSSLPSSHSYGGNQATQQIQVKANFSPPTQQAPLHMDDWPSRPSWTTEQTKGTNAPLPPPSSTGSGVRYSSPSVDFSNPRLTDSPVATLMQRSYQATPTTAASIPSHGASYLPTSGGSAPPTGPRASHCLPTPASVTGSSTRATVLPDPHSVAASGQGASSGHLTAAATAAARTSAGATSIRYPVAAAAAARTTACSSSRGRLRCTGAALAIVPIPGQGPAAAPAGQPLPTWGRPQPAGRSVRSLHVNSPMKVLDPGMDAYLEVLRGLRDQFEDGVPHAAPDLGGGQPAESALKRLLQSLTDARSELDAEKGVSQALKSELQAAQQSARATSSEQQRQVHSLQRQVEAGHRERDSILTQLQQLGESSISETKRQVEAGHCEWDGILNQLQQLGESSINQTKRQVEVDHYKQDSILNQLQQLGESSISKTKRQVEAGHCERDNTLTQLQQLPISGSKELEWQARQGQYERDAHGMFNELAARQGALDKLALQCSEQKRALDSLSSEKERLQRHFNELTDKMQTQVRSLGEETSKLKSRALETAQKAEREEASRYYFVIPSQSNPQQAVRSLGEETSKLKSRALEAAQKAEREEAARKKAENELSANRIASDGSRALAVAAQHQATQLQQQLNEATGVIDAARAERNKMQELKWRADERATQLSMELESSEIARKKAQMESKVHVTRVDAESRTAMSNAESARAELSSYKSQVDQLKSPLTEIEVYEYIKIESSLEESKRVEGAASKEVKEVEAMLREFERDLEVHVNAVWLSMRAERSDALLLNPEGQALSIAGRWRPTMRTLLAVMKRQAGEVLSGEENTARLAARNTSLETQLKKMDELSASLAADQEQAAESECAKLRSQMEHECRKLRAQMNDECGQLRGHMDDECARLRCLLDESHQGARVAQTEARMREEMLQAAIVERDRLQGQASESQQKELCSSQDLDVCKEDLRSREKVLDQIWSEVRGAALSVASLTSQATVGAKPALATLLGLEGGAYSPGFKAELTQPGADSLASAVEVGPLHYHQSAYPPAQ